MKKVEEKVEEKVETRNMTPSERFGLLQQFQTSREAGMTNAEAAEKVGVPFITLYSWLQNELWKDKEHTKAPVKLGKRGRAKKEKGSSSKAKKTLKNYTPKKDRKVQLRVVQKEESAPPADRSATQVVVRLPNGVEVSSFGDLDEARKFAQSC